MIIVAHPKDTVMSEFIDALFDPNIAFLRNALFAGLLASLSFGIIGLSDSSDPFGCFMTTPEKIQS